MSEMKLRELQDRLNDAVKVLVGKKVNVENFREEMDDLVCDIVKEFDVRCYRMCWGVGLDLLKVTVLSEDAELLRLNLDLKEDARYKYERRGTIQGVNFTIVNEDFTDLTCTEIVKECQIRCKRSAIEWNNNRMIELKAQIETLKKNTGKIERELDELLKDGE